jgi:Phage portal protein, SPP1 Gp6-like
MVTDISDATSLLIPADSAKLIASLSKALDDRSARVQRYQDYYSGQQRLAFATTKFRQAFGSLFGAFADNFCALIVDAVEERLDVEGFRIGPGEDVGRGRKLPGDPDGDKAAWQMWQENQLDLYSQIAHKNALIKECSYALVGPGDRADTVDITIEDARQAIVVYEAGSYRKRRAGLKRWIDDDGHLNATLYRPDTVEKYVSRDKIKSESSDWGSLNVTWTPRDVPGENWPLPNRLKTVPLIPLVNRPNLDGTGESELKSVLPIQDAINKLVMDMIVASEFSAYPKRFATGIAIEVDDETGEPKEQFSAAADRVWASENENAKFGTLEAADLSPFVAGVDMLIQHLASQSRTPYHYFLQHGGQPPSGESLRASETGLVSKAERKQRYFGEGWEEVIRLAFLATGDTARGAVHESETIWRDPEKKTESEHVDALVKLASVGVPEEQLWADAGYSPTQIARFLEMREREPQVPVNRIVPNKVLETATGPAVPGSAPVQGGVGG